MALKISVLLRQLGVGWEGISVKAISSIQIIYLNDIYLLIQETIVFLQNK